MIDFYDIKPTYIPYVLHTSFHVKIDWHDAKALATCEQKNLTLEHVGQVFDDSTRIVGLADKSASLLYKRNEHHEYQEVLVYEDRFFVIGKGLFVVFTLRSDTIQVVTAYRISEKEAIKKIVKTRFAYRAEPEIVSDNLDPRKWAVAANLENGDVIAHEIFEFKNVIF